MLPTRLNPAPALLVWTNKGTVAHTVTAEGGALTSTADPQLARTGGNGRAAAAVAFVLIAAGLLTMVSTRRRVRAEVRVNDRHR